MKTIAEFKRAMTVGSKWMSASNWCEKPIERKCTVSQSNSFALTHPTKDGSSWCDWPKAKQVTFINNQTGAITIRIDYEGGWLCYTPIIQQEKGAQ